MKVFIDHYPAQDDFTKMLTARIRARNPNVEIISFYEHRLSLENSNVKETVDEAVLRMVNESNIIIPLITSSYLDQNSSRITEEFNNLTDKKEKFIFPIIYDESNWSSLNWVVRSKVFPEGGVPLTELTEEKKEKSINDLLQTIENIVSISSIKHQISGNKNIKLTENIVFISHDHEDADFAELLKLQFEKNEIIGWIDSERLKIGQDWREEIDEGITKSIAVIAIMSPEAKKSEYVTYEWAFAWGKGKKIFPIMLKQTSLHPRLESLQYLDFTNRATRPWEKLIDSIKELIQ